MKKAGCKCPMEACALACCVLFLLTASCLHFLKTTICYAGALHMSLMHTYRVCDGNNRIWPLLCHMAYLA